MKVIRNVTQIKGFRCTFCYKFFRFEKRNRKRKQILKKHMDEECPFGALERSKT